MDTPRAVFALAVDIVAFLAALRLASLAVLPRNALAVFPRDGVGMGWRGQAMTTIGAVAFGVTATLTGTGIEHKQDAALLLILRFGAGALLLGGGSFCSRRVPRVLLTMGGATLILADLALAGGHELLGVAIVGVAALLCASTVLVVSQQSLALRVASVGTAVLVAVVLVLAGLFPGIVARSLRDEEVSRVKNAAGVVGAMFGRSMAPIPQQLAALSRSLGRSADVSIALAFGDRGRVQSDLAEARGAYPAVDALALVSPSGEVMAADGARADRIAAAAHESVGAALRGEQHVGLGSWGPSALAVVAAVPFEVATVPPGLSRSGSTEPFYFGVSGDYPVVGATPVAYAASPSGVLVGLGLIDRSSLREYRGGEANEDLTIFLKSGGVLSTGAHPPRSLTGFLQGRAGAELAGEVFSAGRAVGRRGLLHESALFVGAAPIRLGDGTIIGALAVSTKGHLANNVRDSLLPALFAVLVVPSSLGFFAAVFLGLRMERPVHRLTKAARRMSEGDLSMRGEVGSSAGRVGELGASVEAMAGSMVRMSAELDEMAIWRTQFLASLAHALRTPLAPIRGYAEMLRSRQLREDQERGSIEGIMDASEELERTIDMLVDFAALDTGRFMLRMTDVELPPVLANLADRWSGRYPGRDIHVEVGDGIPSIAMDERLIERCLDELIDNAVRHSPADRRIMVRGEMVGAGTGERSVGVPAMLQISFADEGIGIPPAIIAVIEADRSLDAVLGTAGTFGLGLPFVQSVARAHGGRITAQRRSSGGSIVGLQLPAFRR